MLQHLELDSRSMSFPTLIFYPSLYNHNYLVQNLTKVNFGRNPLSPVSIGFSPLFPGQKNTCT